MLRYCFFLLSTVSIVFMKNGQNGLQPILSVFPPVTIECEQTLKSVHTDRDPLTIEFHSISSGGSRISWGSGTNSQSGIIFSTFCRKPHENERIWIPRAARVPGAPHLDSPMIGL